MDILSFALYHENGNIGSKEDYEVAPDLTQTDSEEEPVPKKIRVNGDNASEDLTSRVWNQLVEAGGEVEKDHICVDVTDRTLIDEVCTSLEKENKVMLEGNTIYNIY